MCSGWPVNDTPPCKTEPVRTQPLVVVLIAAIVSLTGCSGSDKVDSTADMSKLQSRLGSAKEKIDSAETIKISLSTTKIPSGVSGLLSANGDGNHSPAFKGKVTVVTGGTSLGADVIAVDGKVLAKTSFAPVYLSIDPATLKAYKDYGETSKQMGFDFFEARLNNENNQKVWRDEALMKLKDADPGVFLLSTGMFGSFCRFTSRRFNKKRIIKN